MNILSEEELQTLAQIRRHENDNEPLKFERRQTGQMNQGFVDETQYGIDFDAEDNTNAPNPFPILPNATGFDYMGVGNSTLTFIKILI